MTENQMTENQKTENQLTANQKTENQLTANQKTENQLTANQKTEIFKQIKTYIYACIWVETNFNTAFHLNIRGMLA